jgi:hypothetical protein
MTRLGEEMMMIRAPRRLTPPALVFVLALVLTGSLTAPSFAAVSSQKIDEAIVKAKRFLYSQQQPAGRWETDPERQGTDHQAWQSMQGDTYGGYTALCTYALLAGGESPNSPQMKSAINFLKHVDMVGTYAIAMRLQVWLLIPHDSAEIKAMIHKDADTLMRGINTGNEINKGMWDYLGQGPRLDISVSQYGVLGLWAAQQSGVVDVGPARWKLLEAAWRHNQQIDGGWYYGPEITNETPAMTAAGVASLFITSDYLHADEGVACVGTPGNPWIERGLAWIEKNYDQIGDNQYAMYGIERIGTASGYKYFASHDWYGDLAGQLVASQSDDGSWTGTYPGARPINSTCFGLLFLARGRAAVMMNKLDYGVHSNATSRYTEETWNERPRDAANLASWTGHQTEMFLNWQTVNLAAAPEELHDAPILYMTGNEALNIKPEEARTLKMFIQQGGMVLANADCGHTAFAESFEALGKSMFGRAFRPLPAGHPAFTHEQFPAKHWRVRPNVLGLTNGIRELMILIPDSDPARWWQSPASAAGHEDAYELGTDLYQYSTDRSPWTKGDSYIVLPDPAIQATRRIKVARLEVGTNWDPEPAGWKRLAAVMHNRDGVDLAVFNAMTGQGVLAAADVVHLTGTTDFTLTDAARQELKAFVDKGGTLVVDAAGGSLPFADAASQELKTLFGATAVTALDKTLPRDHPIFTLPGHKVENFTYRPWARANSVGALKDPRIRGIQIGNRVGVFFSREDLSAGLVGEPIDGIIGYTPDTATDIMRNILLYSEANKPKAPPAHH